MYTILGVIAKPLGFLLGLLYKFIGEYGITIIIFTLIVKLCLYPLYIKQMKSTARMTEVQTKVMALQKKYANDKATLNIKIAELYNRENYNPMSGCLPMLIQMPIIMGLFALLRNPLRYMTDESMIFAFHEPFVWINDLSQPDPWILPIIAGVATYISFNMSQNMSGAGSSNSAAVDQMSGMMKMMKYVFPLMILWMAKSFPSGLALYWAVSQVIQIFFNIHMKTLKKGMQEKEDLEKIEAKKKKKKK